METNRLIVRLFMISLLLRCTLLFGATDTPNGSVPKASNPGGLTTALQKMRKREDKIEGITWYKDRSTPDTNDHNNIHLYIGQKGTHVWLRWKMQYASSSWLFIKGFILVADGQRFEHRAQFERDNYTTIWEWYDTPAGPQELQMVDAIKNAKDATVRYVGDKYHDDRKISSQEKQALSNVLAAYQALGGKS
jgi:hypothetical protein